MLMESFLNLLLHQEHVFAAPMIFENEGFDYLVTRLATSALAKILIPLSRVVTANTEPQLLKQRQGLPIPPSHEAAQVLASLGILDLGECIQNPERQRLSKVECVFLDTRGVGCRSRHSTCRQG